VKLKLFSCALLIALVLSAVPAVSSKAAGVPGQYAYTTTWLNFRTGPSINYSIMRVLPPQARVYVISGPYNYEWYRVSYDGLTGYVHGYYIQPAASGTTELSSQSTSYTNTTYSNTYSSKGLAIANTAKRYVGYRYAYYGNTPAEGFSCVGFAQWVYRLNGIWIPENLWGQYSMGWSVSKSELQPGDLVFFQNTWWRGLSHVGIYVGDGWMIDAGSPETGVHWSNINWDYFATRWFGARRLVN